MECLRRVRYTAGARVRVLATAGVVAVGAAGVGRAGPSLEKANRLYESGDVVSAVRAYREALSRGENPALCSFNLGNAYFRLDSMAQSIVYYRTCTVHAPDFFRGHYNLGIAYARLGNFGECIASIRRALELEPEHRNARAALAAAYRNVGALPEAAVCYERLAARFPEGYEHMLALGEIYRRLDDPHEALQWFSRYPEDGPRWGYARQAMAGIARERGRLEQAAYFLKQALAHEPGNRWLLYRIVDVYREAGKPLLAMEEASRGIARFPEFAELALLAGNIAFEREEYERAAYFYGRARDLGSAGGVVGLENVRLIRREHAAAQ